MNTLQKTEVQEALLLAEYAIKTALVEIGELDQPSIKMLRAVSDYQSDINQLLQDIEGTVKLLKQASIIVKRLINVTMEGVQ